MLKHFSLFALLATLVGCSGVQFSPATAQQHFDPVVSPQQVLVYRSEVPDSAYTEIGLLQFNGSTDLEVAIAELKKAAAAKGGNAIIDIKVMIGGVLGTLVLVEE